MNILHYVIRNIFNYVKHMKDKINKKRLREQNKINNNNKTNNSYTVHSSHLRVITNKKIGQSQCVSGVEKQNKNKVNFNFDSSMNSLIMSQN